MNQKEKCVESILAMDGVMAKGYGCVAKYAMQDTSLSITAKGLYAYMCSLIGAGATSYPLRKTILSMLNISKGNYYAAYQQLMDKGYITVKKQNIPGKGQWHRNYYTITSRPKGYQGEGSMLTHGFGFVPYLVMQDNRLSVKSKALYVYLLTYTAVGGTASPPLWMIMEHLGISQECFQTYMRPLVSCGYVVRQRHHEKGRFQGYRYFIAELPTTALDDSQQQSREKQDKEKQDIPQETAFLLPEEQDKGIQDKEK